MEMPHNAEQDFRRQFAQLKTAAREQPARALAMAKVLQRQDADLFRQLTFEELGEQHVELQEKDSAITTLKQEANSSRRTARLKQITHNSIAAVLLLGVGIGSYSLGKSPQKEHEGTSTEATLRSERDSWHDVADIYRKLCLELAERRPTEFERKYVQYGDGDLGPSNQKADVGRIKSETEIWQENSGGSKEQ